MIAFCHIAAKGRVINLDQLVGAELTPRGDCLILTMTVGPQIRVEGEAGVAMFDYLRRLGRSVPIAGTMRIGEGSENGKRN